MSSKKELEMEDIKLREAEDMAEADPPLPLHGEHSASTDQTNSEEEIKQSTNQKGTDADAPNAPPPQHGQAGKADRDTRQTTSERPNTTEQEVRASTSAPDEREKPNHTSLVLVIAVASIALYLLVLHYGPQAFEMSRLPKSAWQEPWAIPVQIILTIWQLALKHKAASKSKSAVISDWEIILASCLAFSFRPISSNYREVEDPFMWLWMISLLWFYIRVAPSVLALREAKTKLRNGICLGVLTTSFIPIAMVFSGLLVPAMNAYCYSHGMQTAWPYDWSAALLLNYSTAIAFQVIGMGFLSSGLRVSEKKIGQKKPADSSGQVKREKDQISIPIQPFASLQEWWQRNKLESRRRSTLGNMLICFAIPLALTAFTCWNYSPIPMQISCLPGFNHYQANQTIIDIGNDPKKQTIVTDQSLTAERKVKGLVNNTEQEAADASKRALALGFLGTLFGAAMGFWLQFAVKPTEIMLSQSGIFLRSRLRRKGSNEWISWRSIQSIELSRQSSQALPGSEKLMFKTIDGSAITLSLSQLHTAEQKAALLEGIRIFGADVMRDPRVEEILEPPPDRSYTELWLQALSAPPKRERLKPLESGTDLRESRYQIQKKLGAGGQGHAYLAMDQENGCQVVLKEFILPVFVDMDVRKSALQQFENEAKLLMSLHNEQIVELKDYFVEDHRAYLVLEHIEGVSLSQLVRDSGRLSEQEALKLCKQMCYILRCLHNQSPPIVHRDFTPDNLILRKDGVLKLIDFNVAKQADKASLGTVVGKHAYMPPEQFRGEAVPQSDIYALGATMFFLLAGNDPEPISRSSIRQVRQDVSEPLAVLIEKSTELELDKRYRSVEDLAEII